jgi:hypothetical protein
VEVWLCWTEGVSFFSSGSLLSDVLVPPLDAAGVSVLPVPPQPVRLPATMAVARISAKPLLFIVFDSFFCFFISMSQDTKYGWYSCTI